MTETTKRRELGIVVDQTKSLWCRGDSTNLTCIDSVEELITSRLFQETDTFKLLGAVDSAEALVTLYDYIESTGADKIIKVCSPIHSPPNWDGSANLLNKIEERFAAAEQMNGKASSIGGWHRATDVDRISYSFVGLDETDEADVMHKLTQHPAWPALSFIPTIDVISAARLIGEIRDPRWYLSAEDPDSSSKLRSYLGLYVSTFDNLAGGDAGDSVSVARAEIVVATWNKLTTKLPVTHPCRFLDRKAARKTDPVAKAIKEACDLFISFIRHVWLDGLYQRELFIPEYFFVSEPDVATAFSKHRNALCGK